jgi:hypothetical protein
VPAKASKSDKKDEKEKSSQSADQKDSTVEKDDVSKYGDDKLAGLLKKCKISRLCALQGNTVLFDKLSEALTTEYPDELELLEAKLNHVDSPDIRKEGVAAVVAAADAILASKHIDYTALASHITKVANKVDSKLDSSFSDEKKDMDQKKSVLVNALVRKMRAQVDLNDVAFKDTYLELAKWEDVSSDKYAYLSFLHAAESEQYGKALRILTKLCKASLTSSSPVGAASTNTPPPKELFELRTSILEKLHWGMHVEQEKRWNIIRFPKTFASF